MKLSSLILLLFLSLQICSQSETSLSILESGIGKIRNAVVDQYPNSVNQVNQLLTKWKDVEPNEEIVHDALFNVAYAINIHNYSLKRIKKHLGKHYPVSRLKDSLDEEDLEIILNNFELLSLIIYGYLSSDFPFDESIDTMDMVEFEFLNIQDGETIADVGAGTGEYILLLSVIFPNNKFYINEIDQGLLDFIRTRILEFQDLYLSKNRFIELTLGSKSSTNLPETVDMVIVRNSFHHFNRKVKMLKAIKSRIKPSGRIVLIESIKGPNEEGLDCPFYMTQEKILSTISKSGLSISRKMTIKDNLLVEIR